MAMNGNRFDAGAGWSPVLIVAALLAASPGFAQSLMGDADVGEQFANRICAACHAVGKGDHGVSPQGAPAFQDVADNPGINPLSLRIFLRTPHETMPNLMLSEPETDDVIAYIMSLK